MSKSGKVISWRGPFGFAETKDGKLIYIHTDEIDGGRLRIGLSVKFDTEEVEGHDGRLKGTNVSGEAVLAKGEKLSDEEFAADKKRIEEMKEAAKEKNEKEFEPVWAKVSELNRSNKVHLVRTLLKELDLGTLQSKDDMGKRTDPTDRSGKKFSKDEFLAFYGPVQGNRMWAMAGAKKGGKGGKGRKN